MPENARDIVFISYRRSDARHPAGRIHEKLEDAVDDRADVYMDVDSIAPGKNFRTHLEQAIGRTRVMIVVIGSTWLTASKGDNGWWRVFLPWLRAPRRLDDPDDYVRHEVRSALPRRRITILPALVDGARMPEPAELPDDIRALCDFQAVSLRHEQFREDARVLVKVVLDALSEPEPVAIIQQPAPPTAKEPEKPTRIDPEGSPSPTSPTPPPAKPTPAPATAPRPQAAPPKTVATLMEERGKLLANLEHLHRAATTRDAAVRNAAYSKYISTLDATYVEKFGKDPFVRAYGSGAWELDAWRQDSVVMSRVRYWLPVFAVSFALVIWLAVHFNLYKGLEWLLVEKLHALLGSILIRVGDLVGKVIPLVATQFAPWLIKVLRGVLFLATALGTLLVPIFGGCVLPVLLNFPFMALAEKWRIPHCDAALARVRSTLDAPPAPPSPPRTR